MIRFPEPAAERMKNMEDYLTIGDFAKLRNVDRKSLRYYERIGALIPAYIDPQTKYRYYKLEQLVDLDTILVCLELGIPLKEAVSYKNEDGTLNILKLFHDGQEKINEKFLRLHLTMQRLQSSLRSIQESKPFAQTQTCYDRHIEPRYVLRTRLTKLDDELYFRTVSKDLFMQAQADGLVPIFNFPIGLMAERTNGQLDIYITLELLPYQMQHPAVLTLPSGTYRCCRTDTESLYHPADCLKLGFQDPKVSLVTISNMTLEKYENGIFSLEIQAFSPSL